MYTPGPSAEELAAMKKWGLSPSDYADEIVEVWPENLMTYKLFADLQTQWNVGMGGPIGLNYLTLFAKLDRLGLVGEQADDMEDDIRAMEHEALVTMSERG